MDGIIDFEIVGNKRYNKYDLTGEYGIGYTFNEQPFYFSLDKFDLIYPHCWRYETDRKKYVISHDGNGGTIKMHRLVTNCPDDMEVDHIFHINYDNRDSELRICTRSENMMNIRSKGISYNKRSEKWEVYINKDKKRISLGLYITEEEALRVRRQAELKYWGDFAPNKD